MSRINELIQDRDMILASWKNRYGGSVYVGLFQSQEFQEAIIGTICGGDDESMALQSYLSGSGAWLPVTLAETLEDALRLLDAKIGAVPEHLRREWLYAVLEAYEELERLGGNVEGATPEQEAFLSGTEFFSKHSFASFADK